MADFLLEMPKAELHLHLEGSVEPETLHELDPATPVEEFRALYEYADFDAFLRAFGAVGKRLRGPGDYALITRRSREEMQLSIGARVTAAVKATAIHLVPRA